MFARPLSRLRAWWAHQNRPLAEKPYSDWSVFETFSDEGWAILTERGKALALADKRCWECDRPWKHGVQPDPEKIARGPNRCIECGGKVGARRRGFIDGGFVAGSAAAGCAGDAC